MSNKIIDYKTEFGRFKQMNRYYPEIMPIISEGDSWFSYPLTGANLMDQLVFKFEGCINYLRLESSGHEAQQIFKSTSSGQLKDLIKHIAFFKVPIVLLSAGGNDVVGKSKIDLYEMANHDRDVATLINSAGLQAELLAVKDSFERAILGLIAANPDIRIITHSYDYPIVSGNAAPITINSLGLIAPVVNVFKQVGPWIFPILKEKGLTNQDAQQMFAEQLINQFHDFILLPLKNQYTDNFDFVDLRGSLNQINYNWNDEIHPSAAGFEILANKFWQKLRPEIINAYRKWQS